MDPNGLRETRPVVGLEEGADTVVFHEQLHPLTEDGVALVDDLVNT